MDQKSVAREGAEVNVFGKVVSTYKFPYVLVSKSTVPVYFVYGARNEDMTTHTIYGQKMELKENKKNNQEITRENREIVARKFESILKRNPEQWLWLHDLWNQR